MSVPYASMTLGELAVAYAEVWGQVLADFDELGDTEQELVARREQSLAAEFAARGIAFAPARLWA